MHITLDFEELPDAEQRLLLRLFTREQLRQVAKDCGVPKGSEKEDTVKNLARWSRNIHGVVSVVIGNPT